MNDITMHVIGNVVNDVTLRFTQSGAPVASFRVAASTRRYDKKSQSWVDGDTHYFGVSCWRGLAANVVQTLQKGMPVVVVGRLRSREVQRPCGDHTHTSRYYDIDATTVGVDLSRGVASFTRVKREAVIESERRSLADAMAVSGLDGLVDPETGEILDAAEETVSAA